MSWRHTQKLAEQDLELGNPAACAVLMALAHHANDYTGVCWPSIARIRRMTGLGESTVQRAIKQLKDRKLITYKEGGGRFSNYYTVTLPDVEPIEQGYRPPRNGASTPPDRGLTPPAAGGELEKKDKGITTERVSPEDILDGWNDIARQHGLSVAIAMKDARLASAKARIKDYPDADTWRLAFKNLASSPFLLGQGRNGWKADIDFFLRPSSFIKLLEGSYGQAN